MTLVEFYLLFSIINGCEKKLGFGTDYIYIYTIKQKYRILIGFMCFSLLICHK